MDWDAIIIGAGQTGSPLAARLAHQGKRVLLVERQAVGGTCVNYGCVPTKTMIASARAAHVARTADRLGVRTDAVTVDLGAVVDRKNAVIQEWREGTRKQLSKAGDRLAVREGHARFLGERRIQVDGQQHTAQTVVLNVGARPAVPPIPGLDSVPWLDNVRLMEQRELPAHLMVLGGGYTGCEFGQMFRRFGSRITILDVADRLLSREDPEISAALEQVFRDEGIQLELGVKVESVARSNGDVVVKLGDGKEVRGSHLLSAAGRMPNTDDLGCDAAGIELDQRGFIKTDDQYRTSAQGVYATGDAAGEPQFTHTAWDDHRILFDLLTGRSRQGRNHRLIPYSVFTDPQVARVGLSEQEARKARVAYETATMPFGNVGRAIEIDERAGIMKVLLDPKTERILGATIVGAEAGELIHVFVTLMHAGAPARAIVDAEFIHPTFAEGLQTLLLQLDRYKLS